MFIDQENKFVFVAVPKTATSTIHNIFNQSESLRRYDSYHPHFQEQYHYPISEILKLNPEAVDYYKFGFCRNPWDRMVSSWIEFTQAVDHLNTWSKDLPNEFKDFEDFILRFSDTQWANEIHFHPSSWYLYDLEHNPVNFIGRYENFASDFRKVVDQLELNVSTESMPQIRKTNRDKNYQKYYTNQKMIDSVESFFKDDIENFGYSF